MLPTLQLSTSMASGRAAATAFCLFKCNTSMMPHSRSSAALTSPADLRSPCMAATGSTGDEKVVQDMLYRIGEMNKLPENLSDGLVEFVVDGHRLGKSTSIVAQLLCDTLVDGSPIFKQTGEVLTLMDTAGNDCKSRSDSIMSVMETLRDNETIEFLSGWRDELYPISEGFYDTPVLFVERAATPLLGTQDYGVHINGLVRDDDTGDLKMWMARRSQTKSKYPGMLDHIVAGGQPAGMTLIDNVVKECEEEAGIPASLTRRLAKPTGAISYETFERGGKNIDGVISRALMFNFDIELPFDFQPKVVDGEVEEFFKCSIDEVKAMMDPGFDDPIKPNCYIVIIDYLMREGQIDPDTKGYLDIVRLLRSGYCG